MLELVGGGGDGGHCGGGGRVHSGGGPVAVQAGDLTAVEVGVAGRQSGRGGRVLGEGVRRQVGEGCGGRSRRSRHGVGLLLLLLLLLCCHLCHRRLQRAGGGVSAEASKGAGGADAVATGLGVVARAVAEGRVAVGRGRNVAGRVGVAVVGPGAAAELVARVVVAAARRRGLERQKRQVKKLYLNGYWLYTVGKGKGNIILC